MPTRCVCIIGGGRRVAPGEGFGATTPWGPSCPSHPAPLTPHPSYLSYITHTSHHISTTSLISLTSHHTPHITSTTSLISLTSHHTPHIISTTSLISLTSHHTPHITYPPYPTTFPLLSSLSSPHPPPLPCPALPCPAARVALTAWRVCGVVPPSCALAEMPGCLRCRPCWTPAGHACYAWTLWTGTQRL